MLLNLETASAPRPFLALLPGTSNALSIARRSAAAFWLMQYSGSGLIASIAIVIALGVLWAPVYGPQAAIFCDLFDTRVRYTGVSVVYQIGAIFSVSLTPLAATALLQANGDQPWLVASYVAAAGVISAICASLMRRVP
jgi:MFS transporter, MHS family, shikimate and dehydroshikimate transport protein